MAKRWDDNRTITHESVVAGFHVRSGEVGRPPMCCFQDVDMVGATNRDPNLHSAKEARDWPVARLTRGLANGWRSQPVWTRLLNREMLVLAKEEHRQTGG